MAVRRAAAILAAMLLLTAQASAAGIETLARVMQIDDVVAVLHDEGIEHGRAIDRDMLGGTGGSYWADQVARIHARDRMRAVLLAALAEGMTAEQIDATVAFFDTPSGQAILGYEIAARRALADPAVEEIARAAYEQQKHDGDARFAEVHRFITVNDLVERNVAGTLGATFHFLRGMADGGGLDWTEGDILADVWSDEDDTRTETTGWIYGFLLMAYRPVDLADLADYVEFSDTEAGRALNAALFEGFDRLYTDISYALGRATARAMEASSL